MSKQPEKIFFCNGPAFLGDGEVLAEASVLVEGGRIARVWPGGAAVPPGALAVDLAGGMLLPGLIDCHVHLLLDGSADPISPIAGQSLPALALQAAAHAKAALLAGITTVRDLGDAGGVVAALRDAVRKGLAVGPRVLASCRPVCMTGGHGHHWGGRQADGPDEVRKAVREQLRAGCDQVKLMATGGVLTPGGIPGAPQLTLEEMRAGVEEAHKANRKTAAHAQGAQGIKNALAAGVDSIEHGIGLNRETIAMMLAQGSVLVPTLSAPVNILAGGPESGVNAETLRKAGEMKDIHFASFREALKNGVTLAMGTDAGTPFNRHGANLAELALLVANGCQPNLALAAATGGAARALGLTQVGLVAEGMLADLVVVKGDPLENIGLLQDRANLRLVMQGGRIVGGAI